MSDEGIIETIEDSGEESEGTVFTYAELQAIIDRYNASHAHTLDRKRIEISVED